MRKQSKIESCTHKVPLPVAMPVQSPLALFLGHARQQEAGVSLSLSLCECVCVCWCVAFSTLRGQYDN